MRYLRRLWMKTDTEPFSPFLHVFILKTLIIGIMFTFYGATDNIHGTTLFQLTNDYLPNYAGNLWGIALLVVCVGHILELEFRGAGFGAPTAMFGFLCWGYAACIYILNNNYFGLVAITGTSLFYFGWYYISAVDYRRKLRSGQIPPVS